MDNVILYVALIIFTLVMCWIAYQRNPDNFLQELEAAARMAVAEAEQRLPGATGEEKLEAVIEQISLIGKFKNVDHALIRMAIEAAVKLIKYPAGSGQ